MTAVSRVGPYEVVAAIGAGGMGEVYRARDSKLHRDVALKILPPAFALDTNRLSRFRHEAQVLAALNHPNIAHIYGFEDSGDTHALVLELVDGDTLSERIARGPIAEADAWIIGRQIATALEYAHERGIIHRDLKPANVKVRPDGTVTLLDFGLAKALRPDVPADRADTVTLSGPASEAGLVLGTPAYMAPEQAAGQAIDRRADVWAFGCLLFEMLTGERPFQGDTVTETLAAVLRSDPDWRRLPAETSLDLRNLMRRCLRKDPRQRLQAIGDARIILEELVAGSPDVERPGAMGTRPARRRVWELTGAAIVAALVGIAAWTLKPVPASPQPVRSFTVTLPPGQQLASLDRGVIAFSEDGSVLAYAATKADGSGQQLYVRAMDTGVTAPVARTEDAAMPFFSPDGQWLGFLAGGRLKKVPLKGGAVTTLTDAPSAFGATWSAHHTIVFASLWSVLEQIPEDTGGVPQPLTTFAGTENGHLWPHTVGASRSVVFASAGPDTGGVAVGDLAGGPHQTVLPGRHVVTPAYLPSQHLVFLQDNNLMAAPFDLERRRLGGDPVLAVPHVRQYAVSSTGTLAYIAGTPPDGRSRLTWVSRSGVAQVADDRADNYYQPRLEPVRGDRVAMDLNGQVWMFDLATHNLAPFTFNDRNQHATWTRDGKELVFMVQKGRTWQLARQPADGSGRPAAVTSDPGLLDIPYSLTPNGWLAFVKFSGTSESQLWTLPLHDSSSPAPRAERIFSIPIADAEAGPAFSPDGQWLAYAASDASGRRQIYVQAFPGPGDKHQVSIDGGNEPLWNPDGTRQRLELFYRNGDDMMAVEIATRPSFRQERPHRLFAGAAGYKTVLPNYVRPNYDVTPDGQRFLMLQPIQQKDAPISEIHVVLNWAEDLKRLAPAKKP
jgi:tRNA A-37 threonylcarbamoyl transferase component Bud32